MGRRKIKEIGCSSKGSISEVRFVYHSKIVVYANTSWDITKLCDTKGVEHGYRI